MRTTYEAVKGFINERKEAIIGAGIGIASTLAIGFSVKCIKAAKAITTSDEESEDEETIEEELQELEAFEEEPTELIEE